MSGGVTAVIAHVEREWSAKLTKKVDIVFHTVRKFSQIEGLIIEISIHSAPSYEVQRVFSASNPQSDQVQ